MGGYCFFNNAAVAATHLIEVLNVGKVCIIDVDFHHGNGTQTIYYAKSNPMYVSLHGDPEQEYPYYWGRACEIGEGEGVGYNKNVPLKKSTSDEEYLETLQRVMQVDIKNYQPDYLLISLGVDTYEGDPVGGFRLTESCFKKIGACLNIGLKTLFVMEGGYDVDKLGSNVANVLEGFESAKV
jgi:acetoin utilization deacetylase AcuC-like enzyme